MSDTIEMFKRAKLGPSDVSRLLHVSRVAVSLWFNGHSNPHHLIEARVGRLHDCVAACVAKKKLPVSADVSRSDRYGVVEAIVLREAEHLNLGSMAA